MSAEPAEEDPREPLGLFQGFGVEIEYMIVDRSTLDVKPVADRLMERIAGEPVSEVERGRLAWSNELVLHVLELKTNGPSPALEGLSESFAGEVREANRALVEFGAVLLPGGAHPWMDPETETRLWPHEYNEVYRTFDRIFSCRGHGWANLQATHVNLPFRGDDEFHALHSAVRAVLPLVPALAASSPYLDGSRAEALDRRMIEYRGNSRRIPSVAGRLIPEVVQSRAAYVQRVLEPIYRDLEPLDPEGILRHEWVNARGAIARFERGAVEIRVIDVQECPAADLAVLEAIARLVHHLVACVLDGDRRIDALATERLAGVLDATAQDADHARVDYPAYLESLGLRASGRRFARDVWCDLLDRLEPVAWQGAAPERDADGSDPLEVILEEGPLARRILTRTGKMPARAELHAAYRELAECLAANRVFRGD